MASIGVFDSGLGGLTVLKHLVRVLPDYNYIYLGDNARTPYGDRSPSRIYEFTVQAVAHLFEQGCELVVLACNTASSEALRRLQQEWLPVHYPDRHILGIVIPAAELIAKKYPNKKIGIIGTRATIQSGVYVREIEKARKKVSDSSLTSFSIVQYACPLLVPLIEEHWQNTIPGRMIIKKYLYPLKSKQIDVLILGCTHYAIIKERIARIMGKRVHIIDTGVSAAQKLKEYLARHPDIEQRLSRQGSIRLLSTDTSEKIQGLIQRYWGRALPVEQTTLEP